MIHYHGTPIGGDRQDAGRVIPGRHVLIPHANPVDIAVAAEFAASFIIDNSAYSYWQKGGEVDAPVYARFVEQWAAHPGLDWALVPDRIDGTEADNDALLRDWPEHLRRVGVPVWHMHESLARLERLVRDWPRVGLGSSGAWARVGNAAWWRRMGEAMGVACDAFGRPRARLHGLRMLDPRIFRLLPLASADSTNAARNSGTLARFGMYAPPTRAQRADVICSRIEAYNSASVWVPPVAQLDLLAC